MIRIGPKFENPITGAWDLTYEEHQKALQEACLTAIKNKWIYFKLLQTNGSSFALLTLCDEALRYFSKDSGSSYRKSVEEEILRLAENT